MAAAAAGIVGKIGGSKLLGGILGKVGGSGGGGLLGSIGKTFGKVFGKKKKKPKPPNPMKLLSKLMNSAKGLPMPGMFF